MPQFPIAGDANDCVCCAAAGADEVDGQNDEVMAAAAAAEVL